MTEYLSEHFTVSEFEYSEIADLYKIPNKMTQAEKIVAKHTSQYLLENIRKHLNELYVSDIIKCVTLRITSGYRGPKLNLKVGGASNSQHCKAMACDIEATLVYKDGRRKIIPYNQLYENIKSFTKQKKLYIDQCIQEASYDKKTKTWAYWVHVSLCSEIRNARYQFLKFNNGVYKLDCVLK